MFERYISIGWSGSGMEDQGVKQGRNYRRPARRQEGSEGKASTSR